MGHGDTFAQEQEIARANPGNHNEFHRFVTVDGRLTVEGSAYVSAGLAILQEAVRVNNFHKGWRSDDAETRTPDTFTALLTTEIAEFFEAYRDGEPDLWYEHKQPEVSKDTPQAADGTLGKPQGMASEIADIIIRALDTADELKLPIIQATLHKHNFNTTRPFRHGGKKA